MNETEAKRYIDSLLDREERKSTERIRELRELTALVGKAYYGGIESLTPEEDRRLMCFIGWDWNHYRQTRGETV